MKRHVLGALFFVGLCGGFDRSAYPLDNCDVDHTKAAIHFDEAEQMDMAIEHFRAAARCRRTSRAFANLGVAMADTGQHKSAVAQLLLSLHLSGGMNHFAHDALADMKAKLGDAAVQEQIAAMGMDPAMALDMRTAREPYRSHDNPELERHFANTKRIFANVDSGTRTPAKELDAKGGRDGYFALLRSEEFRRTYWEQYPVLIKAHGALSDVLTLDQVLDADYVVDGGGSGSVAPVPNMNFLSGAFIRRNVGRAKGDRVDRADLERALSRHTTLQSLRIQFWEPEVARLALNMSEALRQPSSINLYVTPAGEKTSLAAHNDFQCSFMTQLQGQKRWRLWHKPALHLPISERFIKGRDENEQIDAAKLGEPYMDVVLEAGDVLYVPRGCLHATSTLDSDSTSMHLTVGVEAMWDGGMSFVWGSFLGGDEFFSNPFLLPSLKQAISTRANFDKELRKSVGVDINRSPGRIEIGTDGAARVVEGVGNNTEWKEKGRKLMHRVVDDMFDKTLFAEKTKRHINDVIRAYNERLRKVAATHEPITAEEFRNKNFVYVPPEDE